MCGRCGTGVPRGSPWTPASWRSPVSRSRNKKDQNARQHCAHSGLGVRQPLLEEVLPSPGADGQSEAQSGAGLVRGHQVREQQGRGWSLASSAGFGLRPPTPARGSSFFPLLFITALGPQPAWLPPAISPYHCSGSQPWALWRQSPLGPSWQGVEGRWGGARCGGSCARPSWSGLFSLLPAACGAAEVLSGQEWQAQQRGAVSSQPLPSLRPTGGNAASAGSQEASHQARPRTEAPKGSRLEAGLPETTPISGKPWVLALPPRAAVCPQVIQSFSKPPWAPLKLSPILARSPPAPSPSTFWGRKSSKLLWVAGMGEGCPADAQLCPQPQEAQKELSEAGGGNLVCKDRRWGEGAHGVGQGGERAPAQVCGAEQSG